MPTIDLSFDTIVAQRMAFSGESRKEAAQFVTNYVHNYMDEKRAMGRRLNAELADKHDLMEHPHNGRTRFTNAFVLNK